MTQPKALPVLVIGTGVEARIAADILTQLDIVVYGFLAAKPQPELTELNDIPILGDYREGEFQKMLKDAKTDYVVAVSEASKRKYLLENLIKLTERLPLTIVHPLASVAPSADIAGGNLIHAGCVVDSNVTLDALNYLSPGTVIEADAKVGSFNQMGAGVRIGAGAFIGSNVIIGAGAIIGAGVSIENEAMIPPGSVVLQNVAANALFTANLS